MPDRREVLRLEGLRKSYNIGQPNEVEVLHGIDLRVDSADFAALVGPSGSGKSTLLNQIGLLDSPTAGELYLLGQPTRTMDDEARTALRGRHIGFVFQFHHLIGAFTALENVLMPLMVAHGKPDRDALDRARALLADVGLEKLADRKPDQLSGGQQQRVAIARALVTRPALLWRTSPPATWTPGPQRTCLPCCAGSMNNSAAPSSWSPTIHAWPRPATARSVWSMAGSRPIRDRKPVPNRPEDQKGSTPPGQMSGCTLHLVSTIPPQRPC